MHETEDSGLCKKIRNGITLPWADECCRRLPPDSVTEDGRGRMSDYELLMLVLTFFSLLIAVDLKNRK